MNECLLTCVNCQLQYSSELEYKEHYKSEHHRYNVKRKLIGLPPLAFKDYLLQFQTELSSKSQSQAEIYCEVCSKKFMSPQTYKQHINSQKHKLNRKLLKNAKDRSETSSMSEFEVMSPHHCLFCTAPTSEDHLLTQHCFPPFKAECTNIEGLMGHVEAVIQKGQCIFCELEFGCEESVKQHMADVGHGRLDLDNFAPFEPYYLWKVSESDEDEENTQEVELLDEGESEFSVLRHHTLQQLEEKRQQRIKLTPTGAVINGKEVGYRAYRQYYRQHLDRNLESAPREHQKALPPSEMWNKSIVAKPTFQRISFNKNHR